MEYSQSGATALLDDGYRLARYALQGEHRFPVAGRTTVGPAIHR